MKKKILIIILCILILSIMFLLINLIIPLDKEIYVMSIPYRQKVKRYANGAVDPGTNSFEPSRYVITRMGFVYSVNSSYNEKTKELEKILSINDRFYLKFNGVNEDIINKIFEFTPGEIKWQYTPIK